MRVQQGKVSRRLVAVVVTRNRLQSLQKTLGVLLAAPVGELAGVVVVNNASDDGTRAWLDGVQDARLDVLHLAQNTGGAGGFAAGMARALVAHAPDWLVLMDDDAWPEAGALAAFHAQAEEAADAIAAAVYYPDGAICSMNRPARNPFRSLPAFVRFLRAKPGAAQLADAEFAAPASVDWATFVGLFLRAETVRAHGLPDARLFLYADDVLYTLGLTRSGKSLQFRPDIRFIHDCTSLVDGTPNRLHPLWKTYFYHRNQLILYRALAGWAFWPLAPLFIAKWALRARYHRDVRGRFWRLFGLGVWDGLRGCLTRDPLAIIARDEAENGGRNGV
ncbi:MAG: glycosyltransferase [Rhodobacterales bacterium]|nr:MAG: glycosyltransferase [Rhodobacterales bacterium]